MGTPGMAFIRIDSHIKTVRSRYDGHINSFGHGCAQSIASMPMAALSKAARDFVMTKDEDSTESQCAPSEAMSNYVDLCGASLGPNARMMCLGMSGPQPTFAVPYIGLGPVLLSGGGPDVSGWGYDYAYLVDIDNEIFGLIHEQNGPEISLVWKKSFAALRSIRSESALSEAFEALSGIDYDWDEGGSPKIQKKVDDILRKASKQAPDDNAFFGSQEPESRLEILALAAPAFADASADPHGHSGANFDFPDPIHALFAQGAMQLAATADPVARQMHFDSRFGLTENGAGGGQIISRRRMAPDANRWQSALEDRMRDTLKSLGLEGSSFSGGGFGASEEKARNLLDWPDVTFKPTDLRAKLQSLGPDQLATRWDIFDISLAGFLERAPWLGLVKSSLARADLKASTVLSYCAYALGTADAELLGLVALNPVLGKTSDWTPETRQRMAGYAVTGARLTAALSPTRALAWVDEFLAGPLGGLAHDTRTADRLWLDTPATCIGIKSRVLIDVLQGKSPKNRYGMDF
jgi:hypothetical protein